ESAVRLARTVVPDLLLFNGSLPDASRPEVLERLQLDPESSRIPVTIFREPIAPPRHQDDAPDAGPDDAVDREELLACVRPHLRQAEPSSHAPAALKAPSTMSPIESAIQLAAILESSDDAIIGTDLSRTVTSWNRGSEKIFTYRAEEMIGHSINRLLPADR